MKARESVIAKRDRSWVSTAKVMEPFASEKLSARFVATTLRSC